MRQDTSWSSLREYHRRHWGHLTLVDEWEEPKVLRDHEGNEYVADTKGITRWKLRCDCGFEWTMAKEEFPGRAVTRNCNRPECPYRRQKQPPKPRRAAMGRPVTVDGVNHTLYLPKHVAKAVREYGAIRRLSFSASASELIMEGALQKLVNE